jgi:hypothetical protein
LEVEVVVEMGVVVVGRVVVVVVQVALVMDHLILKLLQFMIL